MDGESSSGGGDFHVPFWADAKLHIIGTFDLISQTASRIDASRQRKRLYPQLAAGFLKWLNDLKRSTNESVGWKEGSIHNHYELPDYELIVKVDNLLCLKIGEDRYRLVYPYFSEKPPLTDQWARVGLWLMAEALSDHDMNDMEVLDVLRGRSFSGSNIPLTGEEGKIFGKRYKEILKEWDALRPHYGL